MNPVALYCKHVDTQLLDCVERISFQHAGVSGALAIPFSIVYLAFDCLLKGACIAEQCYLTAKSIKQYISATDYATRIEVRKSILNHALAGFGIALSVPILTVVKALYLFAVFLSCGNGYKIIRLYRTFDNASTFLKENNLPMFFHWHFPAVGVSDHAHRGAYVMKMCSRVRERILNARSIEEIAAIHFADTAQSKLEILIKINEKTMALEYARMTYVTKFVDVGLFYSGTARREKQRELNNEWHQLQEILIDAETSTDLQFTQALVEFQERP